MAGRLAPSSHNSHSPTMCINPRSFLRSDVLAQSPLFFRMGGPGSGPGFFHCLGDKRFLTSYHQKLTPCLREQVRPVRLKPSAIPPGLFVARPKSTAGFCVAGFFDEDGLMIHRFPSFCELPNDSSYRRPTGGSRGRSHVLTPALAGETVPGTYAPCGPRPVPGGQDDDVGRGTVPATYGSVPLRRFVP